MGNIEDNRRRGCFEHFVLTLNYVVCKVGEKVLHTLLSIASSINLLLFPSTSSVQANLRCLAKFSASQKETMVLL